MHKFILSAVLTVAAQSAVAADKMACDAELAKCNGDAACVAKAQSLEVCQMVSEAQAPVAPAQSPDVAPAKAAEPVAPAH